jgi:hypothetical protein
MLHNNESIQDMIGAPKLSGIADKSYQLLLSQAFMKEAEVSRPWAAIGFHEWICAGRWWLLKAQSTLYVSDIKALPPQAFADLLKASFILVDIFPGHPQRRFWNSEYIQVEILAEDLKRELGSIDRLGYQKPDLNLVQASDLRIWSDAPPALVVQPKPRNENSAAASWQTSTEEVLWMGFGSCGPNDGQSKNEDCVILILVSHDAARARIVTQNQNGKDLLTLDIDFLWTSHVFKNLEYKLFSRSKGIFPLPGQSSLAISDFQLTFSTERNFDNFTIFLTAVVLHESFQGFTKTVASMKAFILLFAMGRRRYDLVANYLDACQQIPETQTQSQRIEPELYRLAINTAKLVLDKKRRAQSSDSEFFPPTTILADKETIIIFDDNSLKDYKVLIYTAYLMWNWFLLALEWPIRLGTNWEHFVRSVYLRRLDPEGIIEVRSPGIDVLPWLAVIHHSPTIISLLEHCKDRPIYIPLLNQDWMLGMLWDVGRPWLAESEWYDPPKDYLFRSVLFLALNAENVSAVTYFLDRQELLLESSLPLFKVAGLGFKGEKAIEPMRNPKTIIFLLTIFARSSKMKQHLLRHSSLNYTYSGDLLIHHLNEIFNLMFPGTGTNTEVPPPSRLSAILFECNVPRSFVAYYLDGKLRFTLLYRMMVHNVLTYGSLLDRTHLDLYLVRSLESGNILAAKKLVEHGARLTLQAENIRGDLVMEMYELTSWRDLIKSVPLPRSNVGDAMLELLWDINWVFGGRFDLSYVDGYEEFKEELEFDDMSFWNKGQKSIEVNEMLDKIDKEQGWPINIEFQV